MTYVTAKILVQLEEGKSGSFIAIAPHLNLVAQGKSTGEALKFLKEIVDLYFDSEVEE